MKIKEFLSCYDECVEFLESRAMSYFKHSNRIIPHLYDTRGVEKDLSFRAVLDDSVMFGGFYDDINGNEEFVTVPLWVFTEPMYLDRIFEENAERDAAREAEASQNEFEDWLQAKVRDALEANLKPLEKWALGIGPKPSEEHFKSYLK